MLDCGKVALISNAAAEDNIILVLNRVIVILIFVTITVKEPEINMRGM
jgi:hypothetical protein